MSNYDWDRGAPVVEETGAGARLAQLRGPFSAGTFLRTRVSKFENLFNPIAPRNLGSRDRWTDSWRDSPGITTNSDPFSSSALGDYRG